MSKSYSSRVSKYASYRRQISKMIEVDESTTINKLPPSTKKEAKTNKINTTTSLDAETILLEIERRKDPTGEQKRSLEREIRIQKVLYIVRVSIATIIILAALTALVIFLYRRLS